MIRANKEFVFAVVALLVPLAGAQVLEQTMVGAPESPEVTPLFVGASIGLVPDRRVRISAPSGPAQLSVRKAVIASLEDPISSSQRAVVYNKSMQAYGLLSGEITFAMQSGLDAISLDWGSASGPRPLGPPDVYVVNAASGTEFVRIFNMLKSAIGVKWVEPSVEYIAEAIE
jgi:hypothetical protein